MKIQSDMQELLKAQEASQKAKAAEKAQNKLSDPSAFGDLLSQAQQIGQLQQVEEGLLPNAESMSSLGGLAGAVGGLSNEEALTKAMTSGSMIDPANYVAQLEGQEVSESEDASLFASITEQADTVLGAFDKYAEGLQGEALPKEMWEMLNGVNGQIAGMRKDLSSLSKPHEGLESFVNDIEVLATTEAFKLNRGDYQEI